MPIESINADLCNGCGLCEKVCSMDVIRMDPETGKAFIAYQKDCMACFFCEIDCTPKAIDVSVNKGIIPVFAYG